MRVETTQESASLNFVDGWIEPQQIVDASRRKPRYSRRQQNSITCHRYSRQPRPQPQPDTGPPPTEHSQHSGKRRESGTTARIGNTGQHRQTARKPSRQRQPARQHPQPADTAEPRTTPRKPADTAPSQPQTMWKHALHWPLRCGWIARSTHTQHWQQVPDGWPTSQHQHERAHLTLVPNTDG
jgi:hypothetical protein